MRLMLIAPAALVAASLFALGTAEAQTGSTFRDARLRVAHGSHGLADLIHEARHPYGGYRSGHHSLHRGYYGGYRHHHHFHRPPVYHVRPPVVVPYPVPVYPRAYSYCPHRGGISYYGRGFGFSISF